MADNDTHYCVTPVPGALNGATPEIFFALKGAVLRGKRFDTGSIIKVAFLEGSEALQKRVFAVAQEWKKYANISFALTEIADADIRVAFAPGAGSWSYLGTDCHAISGDQPTMNYGWLTDESDDVEVRRVVLHEFGHALGFIHEHQNPQEPIRWNKPAVYQDLKGPPNNWDEATIDNNMFRKYDDVMGSNVDSGSIMMYPIPASWTEGGYFSAGFNTELSELDMDTARLAYPG